MSHFNKFNLDKMCDQISDAILDAHLKQDPDAKVACETVTKTGMIMVRGLLLHEKNFDSCRLSLHKQIKKYLSINSFTPVFF